MVVSFICTSLEFDTFKQTETLLHLNVDFQINTWAIALLAGVTKSMKLTICGGSPSLWFKTFLGIKSPGIF